ncbi:MAG TPA: DUF2244 domain-containing protein [Gammaproteobacteria bacterium]|nr:DUF2244 domain-containing protein [Gammaproteobacteria bacterium]
MTTPHNQSAGDTVFVIRPNASLTGPQARLFLALTFLVMAVFSALWAFAGYWLVVPFSGLEFAALAGALWLSMRLSRYREVIAFEGDELIVEKGLYRAESRFVVKRAWARIGLERGDYRTSPKRLLVSASGRRCEIGSCLTDEEREALAKRLRAFVGPGATAPSLKRG